MDMVKIYRASDIAEADLIKSFLEEHDIKVFIKGYHHRSMLGLMGPYVGLDIMVSRADEDEALKILNDHHELHEATPLEEEDDKEKRTEEVPKKLRPRSIAVAVMLAIILPGLGSLYARKKNIGEWILTGTAVCYISLFVFIGMTNITFRIRFVESIISLGSLLILFIVFLIIADMIIAIKSVLAQKKNIQHRGF